MVLSFALNSVLACGTRLRTAAEFEMHVTAVTDSPARSGRECRERPQPQQNFGIETRPRSSETV